MNKLMWMLMLALIILSWTSCHKDKDLENKEPQVSNVTVIPAATSASFSWIVEFSGQFQTGVELSEHEDMTDLRRVEATKQEGEFVAVVENLKASTLYYYRIVVWNKFNNYEEETKDFTTPAQTYTVSVSSGPVEGGTVTGGGTFTEGETCKVTATANSTFNFVNWTENDNQVSTEPEYTFTVTGDRNLVANFTSQEFTITATANPEEGGTVSGSGGYNYGDECTLTATANEGYDFINWTKNGVEISTNTTYTFTVTESAEYVAHFRIQSYAISVTADPENGGTVEGGGTYEYGQTCTVKATEANGYHFVNWTENGEQVYSNAEYTFTINGDRNLVANFAVIQPQAPPGAINGLFTINENGDQVYFSQGNLQYIGSSGNGDENNTGAYWKFAEHQWDCLGDNGQGSDSLTVDRDLFCWGTSGYNHGAVCYHPWSTSKTYSDYYAYGQFAYNLYDQTGKADWGYNAISNGGNTTDMWRTLTSQEWVYLFNTRNTVSGIRHAKAAVNNVNGVILLPDNWNSNYYTLNNTNTSNSSFDSNTITSSQWNTLEQYGAVFLPAAGYRFGTRVDYVGRYGHYWSSSYGNSDDAYIIYFYDGHIHPLYTFERSIGLCVRLVTLAEY